MDRTPTDSHLTYIGASGPVTTYDVYPRGGGLQFGVVKKLGAFWVATDFNGRSAAGPTRWEAATTMWPQEK